MTKERGDERCRDFFFRRIASALWCAFCGVVEAYVKFYKANSLLSHRVVLRISDLRRVIHIRKQIIHIITGF